VSAFFDLGDSNNLNTAPGKFRYLNKVGKLHLLLDEFNEQDLDE